MVECPEVAEGNGLVEALLWLGCRRYRGQAGAAVLVRLGVIKQFVDPAPCFAGLSGREHVREALRIRGFQLR
jgi:hypothetical protein